VGDDGGINQPPNFVDIAVGSRMSLSCNLAVTLGLYNGALGTVVSIAFRQEEPVCRMPSLHQAAQLDALLPIIFVMLDEYDGPAFLQPKQGEPAWPADDPRRRVVPVGPLTAKKTIGSQRRYHREYLPLIPASASTFHRAQSRTCPVVVLPTAPTRTIFAMGLEYVGISRAQRLKDLFVVGSAFRTLHFTSHTLVRERIGSEYERLREFERRRQRQRQDLEQLFAH